MPGYNSLADSSSVMGKGSYNFSMRTRFAHIAFVAWLLAGPSLTYAQEQTSTDNPAPLVSCTSRSVHEKSPSGPEIAFTSVTFSGVTQMPMPDQEEIAASVKSQRYEYPLDGVVEEALERVRAGWQNRGYFKVEVTGDAKTLATSAASIELALFVHVDENAQYRLGGITFKNNRVLSNSAKIRDVFPVKDGEIFSREKIAEGLENLQKVYGEYGFINYTGVPLTTFDDEKKQVYLEIDADEGKQFYVSRINVEGIAALPRQQVLKELAIKPGDIYNGRLWELSLRRVASLFPDCACRPDGPKQLDERAGTVAVTLDFGPCSLR